MTLQELLGEELYAQVQAKIDEKNAGIEDKLQHIRYADLSEGQYVSKSKHDSLQETLNGKTSELEAANNLIKDLQKATKGDEALQGKVTAYEAQVAQLQAQLAETKINSALKVALLSEKAVDVDYMTFKINEKLRADGKTLELDENENIKGWNDMLSGLKTQFPAQFEAAGTMRVEPNRLPDPNSNQTKITRAEFERMGYDSRVKLKETNPEIYAQMKG